MLTGRDRGRVLAAAAAVGDGGARVEGRLLDVRDAGAIDALGEELGEVDIVFSNAYGRMWPDADPADEVDMVAATSNAATARMLRAFAPRLRPGGRLIVVASSLGTLGALDPRVRDRFAAAAQSLEAVEALTEEWRDAVHAGRAEAEGFGTWLNIPSKVLQVAAVRAVARERRVMDLAEDKLICSLCPGLIDTDASRPSFEDMSSAQTPDQAAAWPAKLALPRPANHAFYGELVRFGKVLPWEALVKAEAREQARDVALRSRSPSPGRGPDPPSQRSLPLPPLSVSLPPLAVELVGAVDAALDLVVGVGAVDDVVVAAAVHQLRRDVRGLRAEHVVVRVAEQRVGAAGDDHVVVEAAVEDVDRRRRRSRRAACRSRRSCRRPR